MFKSWWFTLVVGLLVGLVVGYALAELQPVPPARALMKGMAQTGASGGSSPVGGGPAAPAAGADDFEQQAESLKSMLRNDTGDYSVLRALGNLYYDHSRWAEAKDWYDRALAVKGDDPDLLTDTAVTYRNLGQPKKALELLDRALSIDPAHWQALYNKVVVLNFDLHEHQEARAALARLEALKKKNPKIPDLEKLKREVTGK